jgi:hypothetical protein
MLDFLTTTTFTMLYDHHDHEIMVMVGMIGVEGYVLGRTDIRRRYEASGNDYVQMVYTWISHKFESFTLCKHLLSLVP